MKRFTAIATIAFILVAMLALTSCDQKNPGNNPTPTPDGVQVSPPENPPGITPDAQVTPSTNPDTAPGSEVSAFIHADKLAGLKKEDVDKELGDTGETLPGVGTPDSGDGFSMQMVTYNKLGIGAFFKENAEIVALQLTYSGEKYSDSDLFKYLGISPSASMKKNTDNGLDVFENPTDKIPQIMHGAGESGMRMIYVQYVLVD